MSGWIIFLNLSFEWELTGSFGSSSSGSLKKKQFRFFSSLEINQQQWGQPKKSRFQMSSSMILFFTSSVWASAGLGETAGEGRGAAAGESGGMATGAAGNAGLKLGLFGVSPYASLLCEHKINGGTSEISFGSRFWGRHEPDKEPTNPLFLVWSWPEYFFAQ